MACAVRCQWGGVLSLPRPYHYSKNNEIQVRANEVRFQLFTASMWCKQRVRRLSLLSSIFIFLMSFLLRRSSAILTFVFTKYHWRHHIRGS
jgi:hypothetical protein